MDVDHCLEPDFKFACWATVKRRESLAQSCRHSMGAVKALANRFDPFTKALRHLQPPKVRQVTHTLHLGLILVAAILLRWPDVTIARRFVFGFSTVGEIEAS